MIDDVVSRGRLPPSVKADWRLGAEGLGRRPPGSGWAASHRHCRLLLPVDRI